RAAGSGWGSGAAQRWRCLSSTCASIVVGLVYVFGDFVRGDVPATALVVASGRLVVAAIAQQRPTVEELLQTRAVFRGQIACVTRQRHLVAAAIAVGLAHFR